MNEDAYYNSLSSETRDTGLEHPPKVNLGYAAQSFIPTGLFTTGDVSPMSHALFHSIVQDSASIKNTETGHDFHWLSVETLALTIDVLVDPKLLPAIPVPGNVVRVSAWLIGDWTAHELFN